jgi:hypothetical protein
MRPCLAAVLLVFLAGCGSATHVVRLDTRQGAARVHNPRTGQQPVKLGKEKFRAALAEHAPDVRPAAHPLRHARQLMFEERWRHEEYLRWTGRHLEPDAPPGQVRPGPQSLDEFTRDYLSWCGRRRPGATPGDCLRLLTEHALLDADGRYTLAMAIALDSVWEETGEALGQMVDREAVLTTVTAAMALYMMLWVLPEPTSKGLAAVLTAGLMAYLGVETLWTLIGGWVALVEEVNRAPGFVALREAGRRYGKVMGQNAARLFVMLVTAAIGNTVGLAAKAPGLPAYSEAVVLAEMQGGFQLAAVGEVQAVAVSAEGFTVALAPGAVAMTAHEQGGEGGPTAKKGSLTGRPTHPDPNDRRPEYIRSIQRENESARALADNGYHVEQNPPKRPNGKEPDYRINGEYYDCYSPSTSNARNIAKRIQDNKVLVEQADRIVLNLEDSNVGLEAMKRQLVEWPIPGLKEVLVIKNGKVIPLYP